MIFAQDTHTGATVDFKNASENGEYACLRCGGHDVRLTAGGFRTDPEFSCYSSTSTPEEDKTKREISEALGAKCEVRLSNGTFVDVLFEKNNQRLAVMVVSVGKVSFHDLVSRGLGLQEEAVSALWVAVGPSSPAKPAHRWVQAANGGVIYQFLGGSLVRPVRYEGRKKKNAYPVDLSDPSFKEHALGMVWERDFQPA